MALADDGIQIVGFVTVSAGKSLVCKLPAAKPAAVTLRPSCIGRLAVDNTVQARASARICWVFVLRLAVEFSQRIGLYAVVVMPNTRRPPPLSAAGFIATLITR